MAKRYLYLIRHGQYASSQEYPHGKLTPLGVQQAELTGNFLLNVPVRMVHCSTMSRAEQTAEIIADNFYGVPVVPGDLLRECYPSMPPRLHQKLLIQKQVKELDLSDLVVHRIQADEAYQLYFQPMSPEDRKDSHELIVCHGNILSYFICRAMNAHTDTWANLYVLHCSISVVRIDEDGVNILLCHNNTEHLPANFRTEI